MWNRNKSTGTGGGLSTGTGGGMSTGTGENQNKALPLRILPEE